MKKLNVIILIIFLPLYYQVQSQPIDFMFEQDPILKVSKQIGKRVTVMGWIKEVTISSNSRIFILGKLGTPFNYKHPTSLKIVLENQNIKKFKPLNYDDISDSYAKVTGTIIMYHNQLTLQLTDPKDFHYESSRNAPILK